MKTNLSKRIFVLTFNMFGSTPNAVSDVPLLGKRGAKRKGRLARASV